jgi:hypothetical protein
MKIKSVSLQIKTEGAVRLVEKVERIPDQQENISTDIVI